MALLGNTLLECKGLSHASGAVWSCAGQQAAILLPGEEPTSWAMLVHPAVLPRSPWLHWKILAPKEQAKK